MKTPKIGFIGLGLMGGWLVKHLLAANYTVHAFDLDPEKIAAVAAQLIISLIVANSSSQV